MKTLFKKITVATLVAGVLMVGATAHAGIWLQGPWGPVYQPTCVPGYWAPGVYGPIWVPGLCR
jgi:hypothetical protein